MKHNQKVARRVYGSTYANMGEELKTYLNSLPPDKINEIKNDFRANGNHLLSVRQTENATELLDSFALFYYINGKLPYTDGHLFVPDGKNPARIIVEKRSLKELFAKFLRTGSNGLHFLPPCCCFLLEKKPQPKFFLQNCIKI